jgi:hypothetical protein
VMEEALEILVGIKYELDGLRYQQFLNEDL